ncbi:unnamed protein product [Boreogadus saida]
MTSERISMHIHGNRGDRLTGIEAVHAQGSGATCMSAMSLTGPGGESQDPSPYPTAPKPDRSRGAGRAALVWWRPIRR